MPTVLVTGGTGFVGEHLIDEILNTTRWEVISLERISRRQSPPRKRLTVVYHDFCAPLPDRLIKELEDVEYISHCGAEVHGQKSLENPAFFVQQNVLGTFNLLEAARKLPNLEVFQYLSSAEALGFSFGNSFHPKDAIMKPSNPYAAAKGSGELLIYSYAKSFNVPIQCIRFMNVYGEKQGTDKFLPATIKKILNGERVIVHVGKDGHIGSRQWIYVKDLARSLVISLVDTKSNPIRHIVGPEKTNMEIVSKAALTLNTPAKIHTEIAGPSHDLRYAIKGDDWCQLTDFDDAFSRTVKWYEGHREYL